ncbi:hypothetical protein ABKN59_007790 [Abortiporus biennis]
MALPAQRHRSEKDWRSQFASIEAECDSLIKRYHSRFDAVLEHDLLNWQNFRIWLARLRREIWQSYSVEGSLLRSIIRDLLMADLATIPESVVRKLRALRLTNVELLKVVFEAEKWAGDCTFIRSPSECKPIFFNQEIFNVTKWTVPNDLVDDVLLQISRSNPHLVTLDHLKDIINCYNENVSKPYYQKRDIDIGRTIAIDVLLKVHRDLRRDETFPSSSLVGCVITEYCTRRNVPFTDTTKDIADLIWKFCLRPSPFLIYNYC